LLALNNAAVLGDLQIPPGNRLEALTRERKGQHSIESTISIASALPGKRTDPLMSKSRTTTAKKAASVKLPPVHPGEILKEALADLGISMNRLAQALRVPANRISEIVAGQRAITGETALRLAATSIRLQPIGLACRPSLTSTARDEWDARIQAEVQPRQAA